MARIELKESGLVIQSDSKCWKVGRPGTREVDGRTVATIEDPVYPGTLQQAIEWALERRLMESDATSLQELHDEIESFRLELADLFKLGTFVAHLGPAS